jgi:hypothetical protein
VLILDLWTRKFLYKDVGKSDKQLPSTVAPQKDSFVTKGF